MGPRQTRNALKGLDMKAINKSTLELDEWERTVVETAIRLMLDAGKIHAEHGASLLTTLQLAKKFRIVV